MALSRFLRLAPRRHLCSSTVAGAGVATPSPPQPPTIPNSNPKTVTASIDALYKERDLDRFLSRFKYHSATSPLFRSKHGIYEVAVRRLVEARRLDDVTEILESHKSHASEFAGYEGFAAGIISLYGKAGMADKAYETFRELPDLGCPRTVRSFNALLSSLGDPDRVVGEFQVIPLENPEIVPDVFSYSTVIRALFEKGDLDGAMGILDAMDEKGVLPNVVTFNTILNGLYKHDRFDEAEKIWAKMGEKSCDPDVRTFNAKLRWLVSKGKTSEAVELFQELEGRGLKPDGYSITSLIMGHCKHGDLKEAKKMFDELRKRGCEPNPWTYEALVPRVLEAGEIDLAISMCNECMKKKCFMAVEVLQAVVDGLAEASRLEDAKKLVESGWSRHYSRESLIMPDPCLALELEKEGKTVEVNEQGRKESEGSLVLKEFDDDMAGTQEEDPSKGLYAKIGIIVKSFEKPQYFGAFGVPPDKNRVKLPSTRTLITVLRSPHIDKKSREQFEMKVRREYITIKCRPHELHKKYFWFQRTRILGAQFELVFSYKTRLDMSRLKKSV